jgi:Ca2+/H+ antiporter, TMEM165/GDT1 family
MKRIPRPMRIVLFTPLALLGVLLFGWIVMLLWNGVLVPVIHVSAVTLWQALGILVLSKILFSSFGGGGGSSRRSLMKQKMMWEQLTPEQKEQFKTEWKTRCGRRGYRSWRTENPGS